MDWGLCEKHLGFICFIQQKWMKTNYFLLQAPMYCWSGVKMSHVNKKETYQGNL